MSVRWSWKSGGTNARWTRVVCIRIKPIFRYLFSLNDGVSSILTRINWQKEYYIVGFPLNHASLDRRCLQFREDLTNVLLNVSVCIKSQVRSSLEVPSLSNARIPESGSAKMDGALREESLRHSVVRLPRMRAECATRDPRAVNEENVSRSTTTRRKGRRRRRRPHPAEARARARVYNVINCGSLNS